MINKTAQVLFIKLKFSRRWVCHVEHCTIVTHCSFQSIYAFWMLSLSLIAKNFSFLFWSDLCHLFADCTCFVSNGGCRRGHQTLRENLTPIYLISAPSRALSLENLTKWLTQLSTGLATQLVKLTEHNHSKMNHPNHSTAQSGSECSRDE